jgi:hypothetical protein
MQYLRTSCIYVKRRKKLIKICNFYGSWLLQQMNFKFYVFLKIYSQCLTSLQNQDESETYELVNKTMFSISFDWDKFHSTYKVGTIGVVSIWYLHLQLTMQSVHITTNVASSINAQDGLYLIQHYVIKFVSDLRQFGGFLWVTITLTLLT